MVASTFPKTYLFTKHVNEHLLKNSTCTVFSAVLRLVGYSTVIISTRSYSAPMSSDVCCDYLILPDMPTFTHFGYECRNLTSALAGMSYHSKYTITQITLNMEGLFFFPIKWMMSQLISESGMTDSCTRALSSLILNDAGRALKVNGECLSSLICNKIYQCMF